jgi:ADP-ribose pyrophosphatase
MTTTLHAGRFLELVDDRGWEYVRRRNASAVVGIVATTPAGELLLVEQHRIPVGGPVIELPAGLVGDEEAREEIAAAAARELAEETGWEPSACAVLSHGPSSAGLTNEINTLVRATGLRRVGPGGGVAGEAITVHAVPPADVPAWLARRARAGALVDHKVYAALWWIGRESTPGEAR